jgi:hypothetical protein
MHSKNLIIAVIILFSTSAFAKENETLFGSGEITHSGYGAVELKLTNFGDEFAAYTGGKGAWVINNTFLLGGGGYGLVTEHLTDYNTGINMPDEAQIFDGYGGIVLGYINNQSKLIHFSTEVLIGAGNIQYRYPNDFWNNHDWDDRRYNSLENSNYFVIEPSLYVEMNVTDFMVVGIGGSYKFVNGVDISKTKNNDLSGFSGNFVIKFGSF